jgi:hypothetical protein
MDDLLKKTPEFGSIESIKILDDEGSTLNKVTTYVKDRPTKPEKLIYRFRERVYSDDEAIKKHAEFTEELANSNVMLDPVWLPKERSKEGDANGFYYVVKGYTLLKY